MAHACPTKATLDAYDKIAPTQTDQLKFSRNRAIDDCIDAADESFRAFITDLREQASAFTLTTDLTVIGLGTAATLSGKEAAKTLSALSTGSAAVGTAVNKDLYYSATLPAVLAGMVAHRKQVLLKIREGENADAMSYTPSMARQDIRDYVAAGSIDDAVEQLTTTAVVTAKTAQASIDQLRNGTLSTSRTTKTLIAWLYPNGQDRDAAGNPVDPIDKNWKALADWMSKDKTDPDLANTPEYQFVYVADPTGRLESDRARAVADPALNIPPLKN